MKRQLKPAAMTSARSTFEWNTGEPTCFAPLQRLANQREVSAKRVEERRAKGIKAGTIYGLSKKADRRREGGA